MLVDVTGIEPVTPCLQSKLESAMSLSRLAFTYVVLPGLSRCLAGFVPEVAPEFARNTRKELMQFRQF